MDRDGKTASSNAETGLSVGSSGKVASTTSVDRRGIY